MRVSSDPTNFLSLAKSVKAPPLSCSLPFRSFLIELNSFSGGKIPNVHVLVCAIEYNAMLNHMYIAYSYKILTRFSLPKRHNTMNNKSIKRNRI